MISQFLRHIPNQSNIIIIIVRQIDGKLALIIFLLRHFQMHTIELSKRLKAKLKGKKSTIGSLKSAVILKTRPKHNFLVIKVPKPRSVIFCPPPFLPTFLREKKLFYAGRRAAPLRQRATTARQKGVVAVSGCVSSSAFVVTVKWFLRVLIVVASK